MSATRFPGTSLGFVFEASKRISSLRIRASVPGTYPETIGPGRVQRRSRRRCGVIKGPAHFAVNIRCWDELVDLIASFVCCNGSASSLFVLGGLK